MVFELELRFFYTSGNCNGRSPSLVQGILQHIKSIFHFLSDRELKVRKVHTTCERCGEENCADRSSLPHIIHIKEKEEQLLDSLKEL